MQLKEIATVLIWRFGYRCFFLLPSHVWDHQTNLILRIASVKGKRNPNRTRVTKAITCKLSAVAGNVFLRPCRGILAPFFVPTLLYSCFNSATLEKFQAGIICFKSHYSNSMRLKPRLWLACLKNQVLFTFLVLVRRMGQHWCHRVCRK